MYRLKKGQESFEIVDGPDAGRRFERGVVYAAVPEQVRDRFARVKKEKQTARKSRAKE